MKTINKNFLILLSIFVGASALRFFLDGNKYIDNIIAFINTASLLYVFYLSLDDAGSHLLKLLQENEILGEHIKDKKKSYFRKTNNIICIITLILSIVYSLIFSNSILNDIVGMIALFISIQSEYISTSIGEIIYKKK